MRKSIFVTTLAVFALATASQCREARAGSPFLGGGYFGGIGDYSVYSTESIPFYWQYSPVYYSQPVPRTYGYSPYAYPPGVQTPEVVVEPELTINPYVPRKKSTAEATGRVASRVKRIQNPFVGTSASEVAVDNRTQANDDLSMVVNAWHHMSAERRAQIVELMKSSR